MTFSESIIEDAALSWFEELGYMVKQALCLAPGESASERDSFADVVLSDRLHHTVTA